MKEEVNSMHLSEVLQLSVALTLVLVALKFFKLVSFSWLWVVLPLGLTWLVLLILFIVVRVIYLKASGQ